MLLTKQETAARLRVTVSTLNHWRMNDYGPRGRRVGKRVLYREADVDAFIEATFADDATTAGTAG